MLEKLFRSQLAVKLLKNLLPMPLGSPNYRICIMVDNDRNVFMPLLVAGFVNADVHEVIKSSGAFRFDVVQSSVNATPDRLPVDTHVL